MKRRRNAHVLPPRVRKLYAEHVRLGLPKKEAARWAWILCRCARDRDYYGHTSVRLARVSKG